MLRFAWPEFSWTGQGIFNKAKRVFNFKFFNTASYFCWYIMAENKIKTFLSYFICKQMLNILKLVRQKRKEKV